MQHLVFIAAWTPAETIEVIGAVFSGLLTLIGAVASAFAFIIAAKAKANGDLQAPLLQDALKAAASALNTASTAQASADSNTLRLQSHDQRITQLHSDVTTTALAVVPRSTAQGELVDDFPIDVPDPPTPRPASPNARPRIKT